MGASCYSDGAQRTDSTGGNGEKGECKSEAPKSERSNHEWRRMNRNGRKLLLGRGTTDRFNRRQRRKGRVQIRGAEIRKEQPRMETNEHEWAQAATRTGHNGEIEQEATEKRESANPRRRNPKGATTNGDE